MQEQKLFDFGKAGALAKAGWNARAITYELILEDEELTAEIMKRISFGEIGPAEIGKRMPVEKAEQWEKRGFPIAWFDTKADGRVAIGLMRAAYDNGFDVAEICTALGVASDTVERYLEIKKRRSEWDELGEML